MKPLPSHLSVDPDDLRGYQIVDRNGRRIGELDGRWADPDSGTLKFLGVNTGERLGRNHLVPVEAAQFDEGERAIQVPFDAAFVREAPGLDVNAEMTREQESDILQHYANPPATATGMGSGVEAAIGVSPVGKDTIEFALAEEQLRVSKRIVASGKVRLRKIIITEQVQVPVEVRREEVVIERVDPGEATDTDAVPFGDETIEMVLYEEKVVVSKEIHVTGAVRLRKTLLVERAMVHEAVRQEDVEVLRAGETGGWREDTTPGPAKIPAAVLSRQPHSPGADPLPELSPAASAVSTSDPTATPTPALLRAPVEDHGHRAENE